VRKGTKVRRNLSRRAGGRPIPITLIAPRASWHGPATQLVGAKAGQPRPLMKAFYMMKSGSARKHNKQVVGTSSKVVGWVWLACRTVRARACRVLYLSVRCHLRNTCCDRNERNFVFIVIPPLRARLYYHARPNGVKYILYDRLGISSRSRPLGVSGG